MSKVTLNWMNCAAYIILLIRTMLQQEYTEVQITILRISTHNENAKIAVFQVVSPFSLVNFPVSC